MGARHELEDRLARCAEVPRKFFVGTMDTYPGTYQEEGVCKFVGKIEFVINAGAECSFAKRNNSVIRGTNTVSKTFTRNDVMEVAMRTYILAIATAALFAIPTAAFSESGHHRYYNRYEGLYDRYESGRCRESRAACTHKEKLGEQGGLEGLPVSTPTLFSPLVAGGVLLRHAGVP